MEVILALDCGTTGTRAMVFNLQGHVLTKVYQPISRTFPKTGWVEQNPLEIWNVAQQCIQQVVTQISGVHWVAGGITNQRETVMAWEKSTGRPLSPAIVWQCRRTSSWCQENQGKAEWIRAKTGLVLDPYFSATKMKWLFENIPQVRQAHRDKNLCLGTVDTWILFQLTKGEKFLTEPSNASRTLLYNINTLHWDSELLDFFEVPLESLPEVTNSMGHFGITDKLVCGGEIPITAILGDQQASLFGHVGGSEGVAKCTYGTGLFLMTKAPQPLKISKDLLTTIAWKHSDKVEYAYEGALFNGGSCIQWLRDGLHLIHTAEESEILATRIRGNGGVYFVPALTGLGAPYWDPTATASFMGISSHTQSEHLVRSVLESLAFQVRDIIDVFNQSQCIETLKVDGGACQNQFLMQFQANQLGFPIHVAKETEATALGVAAAAAVGAGRCTLKEIENWNEISKTYIPELNQQKGSSRVARQKEKEFTPEYSQWREAVQRSLRWNKS